MKILTNHPGQNESPTWAEYTTFISSGTPGFLSIFTSAFRMLSKKKNHDVIVLGAGRADIIFLLINKLSVFHKIPIIVIDCLWYETDNKIKRYLKRRLFKIVDSDVSSYVVWAKREIDAYSSYFGLPRDKFKFIHYHNTINEEIKCSIGSYFFSGGNFGRDYKTLIEAFRGLDISLLIASTRPEIFHDIDVPSNVEIKGFSHSDYLNKMANCYANIVALDGTLLHSGGQQTFLNSMCFAKPTIVTDPDGGADYIEDGVDGFLVDSGNVTKLREKIIYLSENTDICLEIGQKAKDRASNLNTENHFCKIVDLAKEILKSKASN